MREGDLRDAILGLLDAKTLPEMDAAEETLDEVIDEVLELFDSEDTLADRLHKLGPVDGVAFAKLIRLRQAGALPEEILIKIRGLSN